MPLIHRNHPVAEYSEFISTRSTRRRQSAGARGRSSTPNPSWQSAAHDAISAEVNDWVEAVCPPISDVQGVVRRLQNHPDLSQQSIFWAICPFYIFVVLFAVAAAAFQPKSFAHHILSDPRNHVPQLILGVTVLVGVIIGGLVLLRAILWAGAKLANSFVDMEMARAFPRHDDNGRQNQLTTGALLGGIFM